MGHEAADFSTAVKSTEVIHCIGHFILKKDMLVQICHWV